MSADSILTSTSEGLAEPIELGWLSQRLALRDIREDWTGVTSPIERRKLQNRLNQRARRERARKQNPRETTATECFVHREDEQTAPITRPGNASGSKSPQVVNQAIASVSRKRQPQGCMTGVPEVRALMDRFADHAYASYMQGKPALAHLPLLVRYNLATSLACNARILGVIEEFYRWDGVSPMNKQGPLLGLTFHDQFTDWPASLQPTQLQLMTEHHPWVDCFPWPQLRDNLIRAFEHPDLCDEDELCHDVCDLTDNKEPMLLIWGTPEDPRNWEVSDCFLQKWAWLLIGCDQVLMATSYWRAQRGEPTITPQQFAHVARLSLPKWPIESGI